MILINKDGTWLSCDIEITKSVAKNISVPLIISGGVKNEKYLLDRL